MATLGQPLRINIGCGRLKLDGFVNIDESEEVEPDLVVGAEDFLRSCEDGTVDEIYAGHFLEHIEYEDGQRVLRECLRVLRSGGKIGVVVPDTEVLMKLYVSGKMALHLICEQFLYSTVQPSRHRWSYDPQTLRKALEEAGFVTTKQIDRERDLRGWPAWWQCGWDAEKP